MHARRAADLAEILLLAWAAAGCGLILDLGGAEDGDGGPASSEAGSMDASRGPSDGSGEGGPGDGGSADGRPADGCAGEDACGNGDEDCDGTVDEGCACGVPIVVARTSLRSEHPSLAWTGDGFGVVWHERQSFDQRRPHPS